MNPNPNDPSPLVCDLTAIPSDIREEHIITTPQLFALAQEVQELPNGFAIRFLPGMFMAISKFIENERSCCPFFNFGLEVEPNSGPVWLRLTGGEGVKEILQITLFESIEDKAALKALIQTGGDAHLDEVVSQTPLPLLSGVLKRTSPDQAGN